MALLDELQELLGDPPVRKRAARDPFQVAEGVREVTTYSDRMAAARAQAVERPTAYRDYAHNIVDESQDVSPMQWRMVGRRGPNATWTIVGDPAQAAWGDAAEAERAMDGAIGSRRRSAFTLTTNYRNSAEIFEVAAKVIRKAQPDIELPTAVRSAGVDPVLTTVDGPGPGGRRCARPRRRSWSRWRAPSGSSRPRPVATRSPSGSTGSTIGCRPWARWTRRAWEYDAVLVVEPAQIRDEAKDRVPDLVRGVVPGNPTFDHGWNRALLNIVRTVLCSSLLTSGRLGSKL